MATPPAFPAPQRFGLRSQRLGCLPVVNFFLARLGLGEHLDRYLPEGCNLTVAAVTRDDADLG